MNKIGIHFGFWSKSRNADFAYYVKKAADIGFDILEISAFSAMNLLKEKRETIQKVSLDYGIELSFITGVPKQYDISSGNKGVCSRGIDYIKKNIELVYTMGGKSLGGIMYGPWGAVPEEGKSRDYYVDKSVNSMKSIIKTAENCGVQVNVEVVNRFEQFILNTSHQAVEYIKRVGSPNLKILLDTFHLNIEENNIGEAIESAGSLLGHFHLCENNRRLPGDGQVNWNEIVQVLHKIQYNGPLVIESFLRTGGVIPDLLRIWRDMDDLDSLDMDKAAAKSLNFIRQCFSTD
jgi:D-psicose/D-tagatose/L-ribulose 3-epimerase